MSDLPTTAMLQEALALHRRGAVADAAARYEEILRSDPANADAHYYLATIACQQGRFAEGAERARETLARDPQHVRAQVLLGRALAPLGRHDEALACFDRAIQRAPDHAPAHTHRADVLSEIGRNIEAIESYDRGLVLAPDSVTDWFNRGTALLAVGRYDDALASFDRAIALQPDLAQAPVLLAPRLLSRLRICDWSDLAADIARLSTLIREMTPLSVAFAALAVSSSAADQLQCARRYVQAQPAFSPTWRGDVYRHERIRVAYLSADFREHPTAYLTAGLFEQHDKALFDITAISLGPDDRSPIRHRLEAAFGRFVDVRDTSEQEIAELIRKLEIDIVVDLMGFTKDSRPNVMARRPAPIQVNYLGYAGTMGAGYIDYILADETIIPGDQRAFYTEQVVWLPDTYQVNDDKRRIAERTPTRDQCRLPEATFVFCCFNNTQKIMPEVFDVWMRILRATDNSVFWLIEGNSAASANLRREAERRGVSAQRLIFAPKMSLPDHLARQRQADLFLDTLPYNAHTTASDALWAGLPVLTCLGTTFAGRVAASLLKAAGLDELVCRSLDEYEALALVLAREPGRLAAIKDRLANGRDTCALFDTGRFARHIETAYRTMVDIWRHGEKPRGFRVDPR